MKKMFCLTLALFTALLTGCHAAGESTSQDGFQVAIVQQMDHVSLDQINAAITAQLQVLAQEAGKEIQVKQFNGQNDPSALNQIGVQVVQEGFDLVIPIGTTAAQSMANAALDQPLPIVYAAISDPAAAGLEGLPKVTGTSDALNVETILDMILAVQPEIQTLGLLYSNSEPNSAGPIAQIKTLLEAKGIQYLEKTGNTTDEILNAANALVGRVDGVFTPTDNVVMGAAGAVAEILTQAGIPHYTGADSFVTAGAFATCGVNYTQLGEKTAQMAVDILLGGDIPPCHVMEGGIITVNSQTAQALQLDYSPFDALGTLNEVVTMP